MHLQPYDDNGANDVTSDSDVGQPFTWPFMIQVCSGELPTKLLEIRNKNWI